MANTRTVSYNHQYPASNRMLHNDIWSRKARHRMNTARERRSITFINSMSAEAAMALQQLDIDTAGAEKELTNAGNSSDHRMKKSKSVPGHLYLQKMSQESAQPQQNSESAAEDPDAAGATSSRVKLSHAFEKLDQQKLEGDITDPQTWQEEGKKTKFVLGGGDKVANAMEIVEIVNADEPKPSVLSVEADDEERAIAESARINSINKCNVWFEAHETLLEHPVCDSNLDADS